MFLMVVLCVVFSIAGGGGGVETVAAGAGAVALLLLLPLLQRIESKRASRPLTLTPASTLQDGCS